MFKDKYKKELSSQQKHSTGKDTRGFKKAEHALKNVNTEVNPSEIFQSSMFWDNLRAIMSVTSGCNIN